MADRPLPTLLQKLVDYAKGVNATVVLDVVKEEAEEPFGALMTWDGTLLDQGSKIRFRVRIQRPDTAVLWEGSHSYEGTRIEVQGVSSTILLALLLRGRLISG